MELERTAICLGNTWVTFTNANTFSQELLGIAVDTISRKRFQSVRMEMRPLRILMVNTKKWALTNFRTVESALIWKLQRKFRQTKQNISSCKKKSFCHVRTKLTVALVWKGREGTTERKNVLWKIRKFRNFKVKNKTNLQKEVAILVSWGPNLPKIGTSLFPRRRHFWANPTKILFFPRTTSSHLSPFSKSHSLPLLALPPFCHCSHPLFSSYSLHPLCAVPRFYAMPVCSLNYFEQLSFICRIRLRLFVLLISPCALRRSHASRPCHGAHFPLYFLTTTNVLNLHVGAILY